MDNHLDESQEVDKLFEQTFEEYRKCAHLLNSNEEIGRDRVIQLLENKENYSSKLDFILADLVESAGFYPYLEKENLKPSSTSQKIRIESSRSNNLKDKVFHDEQKHLLGLINSNKNIIASAPTSFGKSLLIEEVVASLKYKNILIIQPSLALLDETRKKLSKYLNNYKIIVRTSQDFIKEKKGNIFLLTSERVNEYHNLPEIDFLIIDEFYKFSSKRDDERHQSLNNSFIKVFKKSQPKFYFLGPNIDGISPGFAEKYNATFYKSNYTLVRCNSFNIYESYGNLFGKLGKKAKFKEDILFDLILKRKNEQTIVYCSSPNKARKLSKKITNYFLSKNVIKNDENALPLTEWIREFISPEWSLIKSLNRGIAFHDGSLPRHITSSLIDYFNSGLINVLFCTTTIIEGVNTSAKNIIYFDDMKGEVDIDYFDYSNIKGRAGRLMQHYSGNIFNFNPPPIKEEIYIDIPFFEQNPLHEEILINLDDKDIKDKNSEEYQFIRSLPPDQIELFSRNSINIRGQKELLDHLFKVILHNYHSISWSTTPKYSQLLYCINLCWSFLLKDSEKPITMSASRLTKVTYDYGFSRNINALVKSSYDYRINKIKDLNEDKKNQAIDDAIRDAFHILRHWFQYKIPKLLMVLNELQGYVCKSIGLEPGNYLFYSSLIENDFIPDHLNILIEYGIPKSAIQKISKHIPNIFSDEKVIDFIINNKLYDNKDLIQYEKEILLKNLKN
ncbi:DEAD/DEAH box helicase [Rahnella sikkimica]|uniref:Helicase n=1 Tax=Rahnella sikkimica TaxID=1805933 RepID=A0A2L1UWD2_9GAMM|nr:DEAD/DEAH box helicase [Rahnella sikkimica]AVF37211.1 helicase [Rahnella sikkimica]